MFLILNALANLFVSCKASRAGEPLDKLGRSADWARQLLKEHGEPKTPKDVIRYMELKDRADKADHAFLEASEKADKWETRKDKATRFVPAYLSGKLDAVAAAVVVYPYVPTVVAWAKSFL